MPNWSGGILTTRGKNLQAKVDAGQTKLVFTKMKIGSGILPNGQSLESLTELISPKQNIVISGVVANGNITTLTGVITNSGLATGYQVRELGVYATDPTLGEILYSVTVDSAPDYLPEEGGAVAVSQEFNYHIAVSNAANVSATISTSGLVTVGILQSHNHDGTGTNGPKLGSNALLDGAVTDLAIGNRTANQNATIASTLTGTITQLFSMVFTRIKQMMGTPNFYDAVPTTLTAAKAHMDATSDAHAASTITLTPTWDVSATTVQAGIAELAAEKLAKDTTANGMRIFKDVAQYVNNAAVTGAIKITVPAITVTAFVDMVIQGYNHSAGMMTPEKWELRFTGQLSTAGTLWNWLTATISPNAPFNTVRGFTDGANLCIVLGTTTTTWSYPGINIEQVRVTGTGHTAFSASFPISLITSETGLTLQATATVKTLATAEALADVDAKKLPLANPLASAAVYRYRDVAVYNTGTSPTGTLEILLPTAWTNTMLVFEIIGYNHNTGSHWNATVSGYAYLNTPAWLVPTATLSPNCPFSSVRLGYDSAAGKVCILLGTTTTVWSSPKIIVSAIAGNVGPDNLKTGWSITTLTSETNITNIAASTVKTLATVEATAPRGYGVGERLTPIAQGSDLNTLILPGKYLVTQPVNGPSTGLYYYDVDVSGGGTFTTQTVTKYQLGESLVWHRQTTNSGTTWSDWRQITTDDKAMIARGTVGLNSISANWNEITVPGMYRVAAGDATGQSNDPVTALGLYGYGQLQVSVAGGGAIVTQVYYTHQGSGHVGEIASRQFSSGQNAWTPWKQIVTKDMIPASASALLASVNFSAQGGVITVRNGFNVSSVTRNAGGIFTINFNTALPSDNYTVGLTAGGGGGVRQPYVCSEYRESSAYVNKTATAVEILVVTNDDSDTRLVDPESCNVIICK